MSINVVGRNVEVTEAIRGYAQEKLSRIIKYFDHVVEASVILSIEKIKHRAEITLRVFGQDMHCEADGEDMYSAIDVLSDKADRMVLKLKERKQTKAVSQKRSFT
ncbi:ribosome hibernation-promoting factor, HPF/YfiA family [Basilea psittacipulmonis]|uniref:Ribosome hibernation promoting factor n=1 Tax=Basilea psittacipulmonis DSM 24701 TaxID=1072685 RepID=A0A077DBT3_9BURK|nr:ribosome-associated translation inhibitor RaiA [Basilea psittacipulmonis]AIL32119.1 ribosome hibernation promoting factor HPF [Basilea psittacipulmonis DSM 24701]